MIDQDKGGLEEGEKDYGGLQKEGGGERKTNPVLT